MFSEQPNQVNFLFLLYHINPAPPGALTIVPSRTNVCSDETITLNASGCDNGGKVQWILPNNTTEYGNPLQSKGPGTYKAYCVRFGITGPKTEISIANCNYNAPRFYATKSSASWFEYFELKASGCPNDWVQWGVPDANGNYNYNNFEKNLLVRGSGTYRGRCSIGNDTDWREIKVFEKDMFGLAIFANKTRANASEPVTLTLYGCNNGTADWKFGTSTATGTQIVRNGPASYKARCIINTIPSDWVYIEVFPASSITPSVSSDKTTACPNESVYLSGWGCPGDYYMQWRWVRDGYQNLPPAQWEYDYGWDNNFSRNGTNTYQARCFKADQSWFGDFKEKSITIDPTFPTNFAASNNGPVVIGESLNLAATDVANSSVSYLWTGPSGFSQAGRSITSNSLKSGIYTITASSTGGCNGVATTEVTGFNCDLFQLKSMNPKNGILTNTIPLKINSTNELDDLILFVERRDNIPLGNHITLKWKKNSIIVPNNDNKSFLNTNHTGNYSLFLNQTGSSNVCWYEVVLNGEDFKTEDWVNARERTLINGKIATAISLNLIKEIKTHQFHFKPLNISGINPIRSKKLLVEINSIQENIILYLYPTLGHLNSHDNQIIGTDFTGLLTAFSEKNNRYIGGYFYKNGLYKYKFPLVSELATASEKCAIGYDFNTKKFFEYFDYSNHNQIFTFYVPCGDVSAWLTVLNQESNNTPPPPIDWDVKKDWGDNKIENNGGGGNGGTIIPPTILNDEVNDYTNISVCLQQGISQIIKETNEVYGKDQGLNITEMAIFMAHLKSALEMKFSVQINIPTNSNLIVKIGNKDYLTASKILVGYFSSIPSLDCSIVKQQILDEKDKIKSKTFSEFEFERLLKSIKERLEDEVTIELAKKDCQGTNRVGRTSVQGTVEHWLVQFDYMIQNNNAVREFQIPHAGPTGVNPGYADLAETKSGELYEIKSLLQQTAGETEVINYVSKANLYCTTGGITWSRGSTYRPPILPLPNPRNPTEELIVTLPVPGVIVYKTQQRTFNPTPVYVPVNIRDRIKKFVERINNGYQDLEREVLVYLKENPDLATYLKAAAFGAAAGIVVGTILEDIYTFGVGILDDIAHIRIAYQLIKIAQMI